MPPYSFIARLFLLINLLCAILWAPCIADERETHEALFQLFAPSGMSSVELSRQSYVELSVYPLAHDLWKRLEFLAVLPSDRRELAFYGLLREGGDGPARFQQARQLYLGWLYGGRRGREWAGQPEPQAMVQAPAPRPPRLTSSAPSLVNEEIRFEGGSLDYLIVGSGPAGAVLGHQLSRAGFKVALLERGSFVLPGSVDTREAPVLKVGGGSVPTSDFGVFLRNANAVGGGSTVNVDLAFAPTLPLISRRFVKWREKRWIGADQWRPEGVARAYSWVVNTIGTREPSSSEINANNLILWEGGRAIGLRPALYSLNTWPDQPPWADKRSAVNGLLLEAMTRGSNSLWVLPDLDVRRVLTHSGRAVGVTARVLPSWSNPSVWSDPYGLKLAEGHDVKIKASRVILCAGAQGSAALLLRSGLGGPAVGRGVVLHPSMPLIGLFPRRIDATSGTPSTVYAVDPEDPMGVLYECMTAGPQYVGLMLAGGAEEVGERVRAFASLGGFGVLLIDSVNLDNRVVLDASGEPRVVYRLSDDDRRRFARAVGKAARAMLAAGATEVYLPSAESYAEVAPGGMMAFTEPWQVEGLNQRLRFLPGATVVTSAHMQSTCKMGADPATSVVDYQHRVRGIKDLYVCDSSVFPASVGANPMQAVYTIAKLFADHLIAELPPGERSRTKARHESHNIGACGAFAKKFRRHAPPRTLRSGPGSYGWCHRSAHARRAGRTGGVQLRGLGVSSG